jgi:hypothetical protein
MLPKLPRHPALAGRRAPRPARGRAQARPLVAPAVPWIKANRLVDQTKN